MNALYSLLAWAAWTVALALAFAYLKGKRSGRRGIWSRWGMLAFVPVAVVLVLLGKPFEAAVVTSLASLLWNIESKPKSHGREKRK